MEADKSWRGMAMGDLVLVEILCIFPMYIQHTTVYSFI